MADGSIAEPSPVLYRHLPRTRDEAVVSGGRFYFTGVACNFGHIVERYASSRNCTVCVRQRTHSKYLADPIADKQRTAKWRAENLGRARANTLAWSKRNPDRRAEIARLWARKARVKRRAYSAMMCSLRKRRMMACTPKWVDRKEMLAFYIEARRLADETGVQHHVDHIMPIAGGYSCGLNVPWNLRVITASENARKYNDLPAPELSCAFVSLAADGMERTSAQA